MSRATAISTSLANLLLWHWSQPVSYYVVLEAYKCYPVQKRRCCAIYTFKRSFYQDRLGTNIGKAHEKLAFPQGFMNYDSVGYEGVLAVMVAGREVRKRLIFAPFNTSNRHSTKTGSGQT